MQPHKELYDEISRLPLEKVGKALSFIRFLEQEPEQVLALHTQEEYELLDMIENDEMIDSSDILAAIEEMPDD